VAQEADDRAPRGLGQRLQRAVERRAIDRRRAPIHGLAGWHGTLCGQPGGVGWCMCSLDLGDQRTH
jgi:hypothetical protein